MSTVVIPNYEIVEKIAESPQAAMALPGGASPLIAGKMGTISQGRRQVHHYIRFIKIVGVCADA